MWAGYGKQEIKLQWPKVEMGWWIATNNEWNVNYRGKNNLQEVFKKVYAVVV